MRERIANRGESRVPAIELHNATALSTVRLLTMFTAEAQGWRTGRLIVHVRHTRSADYSGTCYYDRGLIHVNLGRHLEYPYLMGTYLARSVTVGRRWFKPVYTIEISDAYELALFIYLHELYHLLVRKAGRNVRQKESMCDRFAARRLVDLFDCPVRDGKGRAVKRDEWDFQDVDRFVARARDRRMGPRPASPTTVGLGKAARTPDTATGARLTASHEQLLLFNTQS